jgi:hypothetical protein
VHILCRYIGGGDCVICPLKKRRNQPRLTEAQERYNKVHSFMRAVVEHAFGQMNCFNIISDVWRGHLPGSLEHLGNCMRVCVCTWFCLYFIVYMLCVCNDQVVAEIVALKNSLNPHRNLQQLAQEVAL